MSMKRVLRLWGQVANQEDWFSSKGAHMSLFNCYMSGVRSLKANVKKKAKIRNIHNQVPLLTFDTIWEIDKTTRT